MKKSFIYSISAILIALFAFSSVTYTSCGRKEDGDATFGCDTLKCLNWGVCSYGKCTCPAGFDGYDCSIVLATKFIDTTWSVKEKIVKSSNPIWIDTTAMYYIRTRAGYTATSFFIDSIWGDRYKSNIVCEIKSPTTFDIGTFQPINNPGGFKILGGYGKIDTNGIPKMTGTYYRYIADSAGVRTDTVDFVFTNI